MASRREANHGAVKGRAAEPSTGTGERPEQTSLKGSECEGREAEENRSWKGGREEARKVEGRAEATVRRRLEEGKGRNRD